MTDWGTILTSAAVGAGVSSLIQFIGQHFQQKAHARETAFNAAIEMAYKRLSQSAEMLRMARPEHRNAVIPDAIQLVPTYHRLLFDLLRTGKPSEELLEGARKFAEAENKMSGSTKKP